MIRRVSPAAGLLLAAGIASTLLPARARAAAPASSRVAVTPARFALVGPDARQQLLLSTGDEERIPAGPAARFSSLDPKIALVSPQGLVTPAGDGTARIRVRWNGGTAEAVVTVRLRNALPPSFTRDVQPLLSRAGCNSGTCHGKAEGQHGFRLSLFGYDPRADYDALLYEAGGRRIARTDPARSLLLLKATAAIPHGGGTRLRPGSRACRVISRWIASGAPFAAPDEPALAGLAVTPAERLLPMRGSGRLLVTARYSDGSTRDVTDEAKFASNNGGIVSVDEDGRVESREVPGAAAVMVTYQGQVAVSRILVPRPRTGAAPAMPPVNGEIDRLVWSRLARLRIQPSDLATDEEFLRRATLDLTGTLPTPEDARRFLAECEKERGAREGMGVWVDGCMGGEKPVPAAGSLKSPAAPAPTGAVKRDPLPTQSTPTHPHTHTPTQIPSALKTRAALVDELLNREEYADFWALKWADLLRDNRDTLGAKGAYGLYQWIRAAVAQNMPYDRFVREIVTASGSSAENGAVNLFRVLNKPEEAASSLSQVFLGVRIECAQCHHHPFEKWSQDDYYGMVGFFTRLRTKPDGAHSVLLTAGGSGEAVHPRTGKPVPPHPLEETPGDLSGLADRRQRLADWMASPQNRYVPRMLVNRLWAHFLGRGLVEPVDDFRDSNPPSNPELLDALAREFVAGGYDVKRLIRLIMTSRVYQLSGTVNETNARDDQNFSRAYPKRLMAEVLMDAVASATGVPPELPGLPRGTRAVQVWDSEWATQWQSYFLNVFGRPARTHPCECERSQEGSIVQVLHLMNAPEIQQQIADRRGRARALAESGRPPREIVEELFLAAYARRPSPREEAEALKRFEDGADRAQAAEDILWALMNTMEFVFNH